MLNKLLRALFLKGLGRWVSDVANGEKGERLHKIYWALAGAKTWTGLAFTTATAVAYALHQPEIAVGFGSVALFFVGSGLLDKGFRKAPLPAVLTDHWLYKLLKHNGTDIAAALSGAYLYFQGVMGTGGACFFGWPCHIWMAIVVCLGTVFVHMGLIAWEAPAPLKR